MTPRRVTVVASEILGVPGTGGPGTADSFLALALARSGHKVELLVAPGRDIDRLSSDWERTYSEAKMRLRPLTACGPVRPSFLAPAWHVYEALRSDPPDVVIADDWRALAYAALRSRQLGMSFSRTAFVVYCHGPARVFAEAAQKVPDTVARFGEEVAQRASLELADAVVSPSRWLFGWFDDHGWPAEAPRQVIQNLWQSTALGEPVKRAVTGSPVRRLAFFGQLREGKGIRLFRSSLQKLPSGLLEGVDLLFLGQARRWTPAQIMEDLGSGVVGRVASIRFETGLQREAAIAELTVPGTLAVMPSLLENSPYAVAECIENGIPFLATGVGGTPELVAAEDRERVLSLPNSDDFSAAIGRALASPTGLAPALPRHAPERALAQWLELVETVTAAPGPTPPRSKPRVSVVARGDASVRRAERLAERTHSVAVEVVPASSRGAGLEAAPADWLLFIDEDDIPDDALLDSLVAAQLATGADVVTAGVRPSDDAEAVQLFLGDPGSLGLIANQYGVLGLVRRSLAARALAAGPTDSDWVLMARLAAAGAQFVSIPDTLSEQAGRPASVALTPAEGLAVLEAFEQGDTEVLEGLPLLTATLAAAVAALEAARQSDGVAPASFPRALRMLRRQLRAIRQAARG